MSVTISNCNQICGSPTNTSKSKMLYTFTKGARFSKRRIILCDKYYDCQPIVSPRTTSLGFGHKYDFTKDVPKSPSPNKYQIKSEFDKNPKKGFGFGYSRSDMEITGPFVQTIRDKNPGPGSYEKGSCLNELTFSLKGKNYHEDQEKLKIPGPGAYPTTFGINEKGTYFLSKFKTSCVRAFNDKCQQRAKNIDNKVPGPGAYETKKAEMSPEGKYFLSKMSSSLTRRFGTSERSNIARKTDTPGPGNYRLPSQFGHYIAKNALKKPQTEGASRKDTKASKENKENTNS